MTPTQIGVVIVVALAVLTIFAYAHASGAKVAKEEHLASNARVLREFKRMTQTEFMSIVDLDGRDRRRHFGGPGEPTWPEWKRRESRQRRH